MSKDAYAIEMDTRDKPDGCVIRIAMFDDYPEALKAWKKIKEADDPEVWYWLIRIRDNIDDPAHVDALDSKWTGALPGTFIYDAQGKLRDSWEGKATYAKMENSVRPVLSLPPVTQVETDTTSKESRS